MNEIIEYMKKKHAGQYDRAGEEYYKHPLHVYNRLKDLNYNDTYLTVALLHDVVEDTDTTIEEIRTKFGNVVARAVFAISRDKGESYSRYIDRVRENPIAKVVKYYDMEHNSDLSRLKKPPTVKDLSRVEKYKKNMLLMST